MTKKRDFLMEALHNKVIVRFRNRCDDGATIGYVLDVGPSFFLLALIDENIKFNGYQCILLKNVRQLRVPVRYHEFYVAALRIRKERIVQKPNIKLDSVAELLASANRLFPLVTIHREGVKPDSCWIGRVAEITKSGLLLNEIGPDAVWGQKPKRHLLSEITRVEFGGGYEEALLLVGDKLSAGKTKGKHAR